MKKNSLLASIFGVGLMLVWPLAGSASSPDYDREKSWAAEILPGLVVGDPVYLQTPRGHHKFLTLFTPASNSGRAVIVVHGLGIHPDWGMIGTLRSDLADKGFTTLSIQMPILAADATGETYPPTFPEAAERLAEAVAFLKGKGYTHVAIVSHSMGARMSLVYLLGKPDPAVVAWASLGASFKGYEPVKLPILDLYGENDLPAVLSNAGPRKGSLTHPASKQRVLAKTDHFFTGHEGAMVAAVADFLKASLE